MKIIGIDLGKFKSVACLSPAAGADPTYCTLPTDPQAFHDFLVKEAPDRLAIEVGTPSGWVYDLATDLGIDCEVANTRDDRFKLVKNTVKTDRADALKLVRLARLDEMPRVTMPSHNERQHRQLIRYRRTLVKRRTEITNHVRSLFDQKGLKLPAGRTLWSKAGQAMLAEHAREVTTGLPKAEFWRGILHRELAEREQIQEDIKAVEACLEEANAQCPKVRRLQTIPGVGPRLAESVVLTIGDPRRFKGAKQVASYVGLTPKLHQSGTVLRSGRISKAGDRRLRSLLVEIAWACQRFNPAFKALFDHLAGGKKGRRKQAAVALARRILVVCWSMLKHETDWDPSKVGPALA